MDQTPQPPDVEEIEERSEEEEEAVPMLPAMAEKLASRINLRLSPMAIQWLVGIAAFALIAFQLGTQSLFETSEGRYASVSRAMVEGGSLLRPELNGIAHFTKPPITYWAGAIGMKLFGISEAGVKSFLPFAAALTAVGCYRIGLLLTTVRGALCGTIVLLTSLFFAVQFRGLTADPLLAMFETWMVWALIRYRTKPSRAVASGFWALAGFAFLTKGPPGLLPLLGLIPGIALRGGGESLKSLLKHTMGWLLFAVIGLGWYIWVGLKVPGLFQYFLFDETIARVATETHGRTGPVYYFVGVLVAGMFPWTAFFAGGLAQSFREAKSKDQPWALPVFLWFAIPFVILSLVKSKLAPYALPLLIPASLMTGFYLSNLFSYDNDEPFAYKVESALTIIILAFLGVSIMTFSLLGALPDPKISRIAFFISFYFMFLAVFGYAFMNFGIVKGIILVLGVTVPGVMLMILPAINGDEMLLKNRAMPGYRKILRKVAALPASSRILFVNDILESGKFYTGRDIPTWNVKRETRFDSRAEKQALSGNDILNMMASPDLYLLMRHSSRDEIRNITKYNIEEIDRQEKWGLYICGRSLTDQEIAALPVSAATNEPSPADEMPAAVSDVPPAPGTGAATIATPEMSLSAPAGTIPKSAHIDTISSVGKPEKNPDPAATEWAAAMTKKSAQQVASGSAEKPAQKPIPKTGTKPAAQAAGKTPAKPAESSRIPAPKVTGKKESTATATQNR